MFLAMRQARVGERAAHTGKDGNALSAQFSEKATTKNLDVFRLA